tara:strand:- start:5245 stop:5613 length:369 start_codon:yes stop_codon:yes gene_type:complete
MFIHKKHLLLLKKNNWNCIVDKEKDIVLSIKNTETGHDLTGTYAHTFAVQKIEKYLEEEIKDKKESLTLKEKQDILGEYGYFITCTNPLAIHTESAHAASGECAEHLMDMVLTSKLRNDFTL